VERNVEMFVCVEKTLIQVFVLGSQANLSVVQYMTSLFCFC